MKTIKLFLKIILLTAISASTYASELPDTHGNRLVAARSYLEIASMKDMMRDMIVETAKNLPDNIRQPYIQYMTKTMRVEVLESIALASMAKHFTLKELNALAAFYGSPEGRSAMKKFGAYMGDVMPVIQQELIRAQQQVETEFKKK